MQMKFANPFFRRIYAKKDYKNDGSCFATRHFSCQFSKLYWIYIEILNAMAVEKAEEFVC